jgi:geranylgeranyl diphosphate synthase type I
MINELIAARSRIKQFLEVYLDEKSQRFSHVNSWSTDSSALLYEYSTRGKMVRGGLIVVLYEALGGSDDIASIGAAMELVQSSVLIHDDIMDQDDMRRGLAAMHIQLAGIDNNREPLSCGEALAICLGDIGFFMAYDILASEGSEVISLFSDELTSLGYGQMGDVEMGVSLDNPTYEEIQKIFRYKTGRYTFSLPFMMAAVRAERFDLLEGLSALGEELGVVFQLRDDELALFGSQEDIGKPVGGDIAENKKTYHRALLFSCATDSEREWLESVFGSPVTADIVDKVVDLANKYDVCSRVRTQADKHDAKACKILSSLDISDTARVVLEELIAYNAKRSA